MTAPSVFKIENAQLGLSTTDPGLVVATAELTDYTSFGFQVTSAQIVPQPKITVDEVPATFEQAATEVNQAAATAFRLQLSMIQDPSVAAGVQQWLYDNDGETVWFFLGLADLGAEAAPKAIGSAICTPLPFGGAARKTLLGDVTWNCHGKPQILFGPTVAGGVAVPA